MTTAEDGRVGWKLRQAGAWPSLPVSPSPGCGCMHGVPGSLTPDGQGCLEVSQWTAGHAVLGAAHAHPILWSVADKQMVNVLGCCFDLSRRFAGPGAGARTAKRFEGGRAAGVERWRSRPWEPLSGVDADSLFELSRRVHGRLVLAAACGCDHPARWRWQFVRVIHLEHSGDGADVLLRRPNTSSVMGLESRSEWSPWRDGLAVVRKAQ